MPDDLAKRDEDEKINEEAEKKEPKNEPEEKPARRSRPSRRHPGSLRQVGEPLSETALVLRPERIRGVDAWGPQDAPARTGARLGPLTFTADGCAFSCSDADDPRRHYAFDSSRAALTSIREPKLRLGERRPGPGPEVCGARLNGLQVELLGGGHG